MSRARTTRDPIEIRLWVEEHGGVPAEDGAGVRIDFRGGARPGEAAWVRWFEAFEAHGLALRYLPEGGSRCHELVRGPRAPARIGPVEQRAPHRGTETRRETLLRKP